MGTRTIDRGADYRNLGRGWFGTASYLPVDALEFAHFFGTAYPDNRMRDRWDYALNDRNAGPLVDGTLGVDFMQNGYYDLPVSTAMLGPAFSLYALVLRTQGQNGANDAAYLSNYNSPFAITLSAGHGTPGQYGLLVSDAGGGILSQVAVPMTAATGQVWELVVGTIDGKGNASVFVKRPGASVVSATVGGLPGGVAWSKRTLRAGKAYDGAFVYGDAVSAVGGYSRAHTASDVEALWIGLGALARRFGGPNLPS